MKKYKLIIFDLDGTLIQNPLFYKTIYSQSLTDLVGNLKGEKGLSVLSYCRQNLDDRGELALPMLNIPYAVWAEKLEKLPLDLIQKNISLVRKMRDISAKKIIYTGSPLLLAKRMLKKTGFDLTEFDEIIGWKSPEEFPIKWSCSSFIFKSLIKRYKVTESSTIAIGDNWTTDLSPAISLNCKICKISDDQSLITLFENMLE